MYNMNKENRILISASFVILLLIITSINFGGITGKAILDKSETEIMVTPSVINPGGLISVFVSPGPDGINEKISFYQAEDNLRKISLGGSCSDYKCFNDVNLNFVIPTNWEYGVYYVQVYDYGVKDFVKTEFTIINN